MFQKGAWEFFFFFFSVEATRERGELAGSRDFWDILEGVKKDRGGFSWVRVFFFSISGFKDILEGFDIEDELLTDLGGDFESRVWENQGANKEVSFPFLSLHSLSLRRAATDFWLMHCFYSS